MLKWKCLLRAKCKFATDFYTIGEVFYNHRSRHLLVIKKNAGLQNICISFTSLMQCESFIHSFIQMVM